MAIKKPSGGKDNDSRKTVRTQRAIQAEQDAKDKNKSRTAKPAVKAVQAGARLQPETPLPAQHLEKPGREAEMQLKPRFLAPGYEGSNKLRGKVALITGGDSGIGRAVAVLLPVKAPTWPLPT